MPPEIDTAANVVGALIKALVKKGTLTKGEANDILDEAKTALGRFVNDDVMATSVQMIERLRENCPPTRSDGVSGPPWALQCPNGKMRKKRGIDSQLPASQAPCLTFFHRMFWLGRLTAPSCRRHPGLRLIPTGERIRFALIAWLARCPQRGASRLDLAAWQSP
jgi:hypothetical protein